MMYQPYEKTEPFNGNARKAMDFAATMLTAAGYQIGDQSEAMIAATAPRTGDRGRGQALLRNVASIEIRAAGRQLTARAELVDYPIMQKFGGLLLGLVVTGGMYYFMTHTGRPMPAEFKHVFFAFIAVYFSISIMTALIAVRWTRIGAWRSVDAFLRNLAAASGGAGASTASR
jgi:hypothetical protein